MKGFHSFIFSTGLLLAWPEAFSFQLFSYASPGVLGFQIQRRTATIPLSRSILQRRGTVQESLENNVVMYYVNATLGTPAQSLRLLVDTGSGDLWVNTPSSSICKSTTTPCDKTGTYTANSSSTYSYVSSDFRIFYSDGSNATGDYATDTFAIGGVAVTELRFGIGYTSTSQEGVLGIGYGASEARRSSYSNFPATLVEQGKIASIAYSLWLNDLNSSSGSILFGGVDTKKFHGNLSTFPILAGKEGYRELAIALTGISMGNTTIASGQSISAVFDSGASFTYLPDSIVSAIYDQLQIQYNRTVDVISIPCSLAQGPMTINFTFISITISIPMRELVIEKRDGTGSCYFGIAPAQSGPAILGETFIRSTYVVYDLSNNQISIAPTIFNTEESNIQPIKAGAGGVPSATIVESVPTGSTVLSSTDAGASHSGASHSAAVTMNPCITCLVAFSMLLVVL